MTHPEDTIGPNPTGLCMCGCGQKTAIARYNNAKRRDVAGQPVRYIRGHKPRTWRKPLESRYDIDLETGCWIWNGQRDHHGYGRLSRGETRIAHRAMYEAVKGPIPAGMVLDHRCPAGPNRACVNPDHVVPCSNADNTHTSGKVCKLNPVSVQEIRFLAGKISQREIAKRFDISQQQVSKIVRGDRWADV